MSTDLTERKKVEQDCARQKKGGIGDEGQVRVPGQYEP